MIQFGDKIEIQAASKSSAKLLLANSRQNNLQITALSLPGNVVRYVVKVEEIGMAATKIQKRVGKAQARDELSALIEAVSTGAGPVEITDCGKVVAVLVSEKEYEWLCACVQNAAIPKRDACGVISLSDDNALGNAARQLVADFDASIAKTASEM